MKVRAGLAFGALLLLGIGMPALLAGATSTSSSGSSVAISSPTATGRCQQAAGNCTSITVPATTSVDAVFDTSPVPLVVTNTGNTDLTGAALSITTSVNGPAGSALENQVNVCLQGARSTVAVNGPLSRAFSLTPSATLTGPKLSPGTSTQYALSFYAGEDSACGDVVSSDPRTAAAWSSPPFTPTASYKGTGTYVTPPSLANSAERGTVTVTVTVDLTSTVNVTPSTSASSSSGGSTTAGSNSGGANTTQRVPVATAASGSSLAFTGADIAAMTIGGLLVVLLGLLLLLVGRRRRSQAAGDPTP